MPRPSRRQSQTNIYHIMVRGNEKKNIFNDREDRYRLLDILENKKVISGCELYAYCLMSNHIHLLVKEVNEEISLFMKRVNVSYAYYFNKKYERVGHVFQDRFKSQPIEDDRRLLAVIQYIHQNPVKAKMVDRCSDYEWSSYNSYHSKDARQGHLLDREFILSIVTNGLGEKINAINDDSQEIREEDLEESFIDIVEETEDKEITIRGYAEGVQYIESQLENNNLSLNDLRTKENKSIRNTLAQTLKDHSNLSIRDIADILKIGRGIVQRL